MTKPLLVYKKEVKSLEIASLVTISLVEGGIDMPYFTIKQIGLFPSYQLNKKEEEKLNRFLVFLENSGVGELIHRECYKDHSKGGRPPYNYYNLFAASIYAFSKHPGTLRKIEDSFAYDVRFMYLMDNEVPSYAKIGGFLNNLFVKLHHEIYSLLVSQFIKETGISVDDCFLDGTKIEANANKYKFVWKPTTFHKRLDGNIKALLSKYFTIGKTEPLKSIEVAEYITKLGGLALGKDGRKDYRRLEKYLLKLLEYEEKEEICGPNRNSYFKTDKDATAMALKEDFYSGVGSNMHAAYNIQIIVSKGIALTYYVGQERTDFRAFIPTIEQFHADYGFYPRNLCADAGYGSWRNYAYMAANGIGNYVKSQDWEQLRKGNAIDLYSFNDKEELVCLNGRTATRHSEYNGRHPKGHGYLYVIADCRRCRYQKACKSAIMDKKAPTRIFDVSYELWNGKIAARRNLLTAKGIEMRVNRSAQVEGVFGIVKQDMQYDRFRRRGLDKVHAEICLILIGHLLRKLFTFYDGKARFEYWVAPSGLKDEEMPTVDAKTFRKKIRKKDINESLRLEHRKKKKVS